MGTSKNIINGDDGYLLDFIYRASLVVSFSAGTLARIFGLGREGCCVSDRSRKQRLCLGVVAYLALADRHGFDRS